MAAEKLTAKKVASLKTPGWYGDGRGLWFQIKQNGSRCWALRYTINKRARIMGLGPYPEISLAEARARCAEARSKIKDPLNPQDPIEIRRTQIRNAEKASISFDDLSAKYIAANKSGWKNTKHADQWANTLATYASPVIGKLNAEAIETDDVLRVLEPIWHTKTETANRVRQRIEKVLDYAKARQLRSGDNPARWRGHLDSLLPKPTKVAKVKSFPALDHSRIGSFMQALRMNSGMGAKALELLILTNTRTTEVLEARPAEFDLQRRLWVIPEHRMKAEKEHTIPLSAPALALVRSVIDDAAPLLFTGSKGKRLSENTLLAVIKRMHDATPWTDANGRRITAHGFRSTFREWAGEMTAHARETIEFAMSHQLKDKAEAAYMRSTMLEKRRNLMDDWAKRCATPDEGNRGNVVLIHRGNLAANAGRPVR